MEKLEICKEELKKLIAEGRSFILSLQDSEDTTNKETGKEYRDVTRFRQALDHAAAALKIISLALLFALPAHAWEFRDNPDRFPSVGVHVDNLRLGGDRTETVINNAGRELPYRHSDETEYGWRGGADVRLPATQSLTFTLAYDHVETDDYFTRHNELGGDMYKEHKAMSGYSYGIGARLYFNK